MSYTPPGWDPFGLLMGRRNASLPVALPTDTYRTPVEMTIMEDPSDPVPLAMVFKKITIANLDPLRNKKIKKILDHSISKAKKAALKGKSSVKYKIPWYFIGIKWNTETQRALVKSLREEFFITKNFVGTEITENYTFDYPSYPIEICW